MRAQDADLARLDAALRRLLTIGVLTSAALMAAGLVFVFVGSPGRASTWTLDAGLFALMLTPVLRVVVSFVEYVRQKDWVFAGATLVVLVVLGAAIAVALAR